VKINKINNHVTKTASQATCKTLHCDWLVKSALASAICQDIVRGAGPKK